MSYEAAATVIEAINTVLISVGAAIGVALVSGLISYRLSSKQLAKAEEQMKQQKDKFDAEVDRRKKEKAVELVNYFNAAIHPQMEMAARYTSGTGYQEILKSGNFSAFRDFTEEEFKGSFDANLYDLIKLKSFTGANNDVYRVLDNLEYFSIVVNYQIADSDIAFRGVSHPFLTFVELLYPLICIKSADPRVEWYENVKALYSSWVEKDPSNSIS